MRERFLNGPNPEGTPNGRLHGTPGPSKPAAEARGGNGEDVPGWPDPNANKSGQDADREQQPNGLRKTRRRFSEEIRMSMESLDHHNIGSQDSEDSVFEFGPEPDYYNDIQPNGIGDGVQYVNIGDDEDEDDLHDFGVDRINSFGDSSHHYGDRSPHPFEGYRSGRSSIALEAEIKAMDQPTTTANADEMFGERYPHSSNPTLSDIVRDHEKVFSDLFASDGEEEEEFDPSKPPASLFASSASIVAEMSRRKRHAKRSHNFSTWDGRDATPDRLRQQEQQISAGGKHPIEMLEKTNSLGMSDRASDISGLLPLSEFSPQGPGSANLLSRIRSHTGGSSALGNDNNDVGATPTTPRAGHAGGQHAGSLDPDKYKDGAPPPTTPTTFIARDTHHRPPSRVLHRVPPFQALEATNGVDKGKAAEYGVSGGHESQHGRQQLGRTRRPAGPRSFEGAGKSLAQNTPYSAGAAGSSNNAQSAVRSPAADRQHNQRAAVDFASAAQETAAHSISGSPGARAAGGDDPHGLGSLFQDSLPNLNFSLLSKTPNSPFRAISRILNTPRASPGSPVRGNAWNSASSSLMGSNANYVPFQEPTVDIDCLPKYLQVDLESKDANDMQGAQAAAVDLPASPRRSGVSADMSRRGSNQQSVAIVEDHELDGVVDYGSDDVVATVKYDSSMTPESPIGVGGQSLSPVDTRRYSDFSDSLDDVHLRGAQGHIDAGLPNLQSRSSPTLRDIYELLKKTVSRLDSQQQQDSKSQDTISLQAIESLIRQNSAPARVNHGGNQQPLQQSQGYEDGQESVVEYGASDNENMASQSYPDIRPTAPTPRRSRRGPTFDDEQLSAQEYDGEMSALQLNVPNGNRSAGGAAAQLVRSETAPGTSAAGRGRSDTVQSRVQAYLQRHMSESMVGNYSGADLQKEMEPSVGDNEQDAAQPPVLDLAPAANTGGSDVQNDALLLLTKALAAGGDLGEVDIPPALLEKVPDLVSALGKISASASRNTVTAPAETAGPSKQAGDEQSDRDEMIRLQKELLSKFDECRTEVDLLRAEVRQGSTIVSTPPQASRHRVANTSTIAPHDSVSMVGARRSTNGLEYEEVEKPPEEAEERREAVEDNRLMTPSPRPDSVVRPMYTVPTTAKNKQRQMVQWLNEQGSRRGSLESPAGSLRTQAEKATQAPDTPTNTRVRISRESGVVGSPLSGRSRTERPLRHDMMVFTTPSLDRARRDAPASSPSKTRRGHQLPAAANSSRMHAATVEDVGEEDDEAERYYYREDAADRDGVVDGHEEEDRYFEDMRGTSSISAKRASAFANPAADARADAAEEDNSDALSDTSTTVPDYQPAITRSPIDPAMINPANIPSRRQLDADMLPRGPRESKRSATGRSGTRHQQQFNPWEGHDDLLEHRATLDSLRSRTSRRGNGIKGADYDSVDEMMYSKEMARQLADTLSELQRVHASHFHRLGTKAEAAGCPVCAMLKAQDQDPYLFGRNAVAYKSMSTRQLQGLLNAYVAAMEDEFAWPRDRDGRSGMAMAEYQSYIEAAQKLRTPAARGKGAVGVYDEETMAALDGISQGKGQQEVYHSFTPSRKNRTLAFSKDGGPVAFSGMAAESEDAKATRVVIELLRDELDALSRRYHRMVEEFHALNPTNVSDQRRRRQMTRELKDLVDMLDVKGEQIAVLARLHPSSASSGEAATAAFAKRRGQQHGKGGRTMMSSTQRAYQSARALQQALGDLY
ncbi:hypothetical protein GQ54DRAFT_211178 [Martensiomyces pterosporus]|nr:hypothetical protein GQ54DRAFT_211178 [Martensiomyces pterosporus]